MITFKLNRLNTFLKLLFGAAVFLILIVLNSREMNFVLLVIIFLFVFLLEILFFFFGKRLVELNIDKNRNEIILVFSKFFFLRYTEVLIFKDLSFSYKDEYGARGIKSKEFRMYNKNNIKLFGIGVEFDGWKNKTINDVIYVLRELNIGEVEKSES